jgi:KDO2-lipid IV(A) lauroyltransferase
MYLRNLAEFLPAWALLKSLSLLPRRQAIFVGKRIARLFYRLNSRLKWVGRKNLQMAMPHLSVDDRDAILKAVVDNLGRLLGEFSQFPKITRKSVEDIVTYEGFENYQRAKAHGRGVLLLTGHFGAWELCAFAQGLYGHPLSFLVRPQDNPLLDRLIRRYREMSGNRIIAKNRAVKQVLQTLKSGGDVGLLIDVNTFSDQGVFCDFFGIQACSTTGLAIFALRSDAPVVPGFLIWDEQLKRHQLRFGPEVPLMRTGDFKEEVSLNTARFTKVIEEMARRHPDHWLWVHKRWQTRPEGEPDLYKRDDPGPGKGASVNMEAEA